MNETGLVFDIKRMAVDDGPGIRTTVFLKGCPLHCPWCHSPESIDSMPQLAFYSNRCIYCARCVNICPEGAQTISEGQRRVEWSKCTNCGRCANACPSEALRIVGKWRTVPVVVQEVLRDRVYYQYSGGGVTFSGGEPLLQSSFLLSLLRECKKEGLHIALDTTGFAAWSKLSKIMPYVDLFLYDLKYYDSKRHLKLTGVDNTVILANLERLKKHGKEIEVRMPIIPGYTDDRADVQRRIAFVRSLGIERMTLLPYNAAAGSKYRIIGKEYTLQGQELSNSTGVRNEQGSDPKQTRAKAFLGGHR